MASNRDRQFYFPTPEDVVREISSTVDALLVRRNDDAGMVDYIDSLREYIRRGKAYGPILFAAADAIKILKAALAERAELRKRHDEFVGSETPTRELPIIRPLKRDRR
jgi:hypothetical protein